MNTKIHKYTNIYKTVHLLLKISLLFLRTEVAFEKLFSSKRYYNINRMTYNFLYSAIFFIHHMMYKNLK